MINETLKLRNPSWEIPTGSPFRLDRDPNIVRGDNHERVNNALFTLGYKYCQSLIFRLLEPYWKGKLQDHSLLFGQDSDGREMLMLWQELAYTVITAAETEGVTRQLPSRLSISTVPVFDRNFLERQLGRLLQKSAGLSDQPEENGKSRKIDICRQGIDRGEWPISKKGGVYSFDNGPDTVYFLAVQYFLSHHGFAGLIDHLEEEGLWDKEKFFLNGPFYSLLMENIFFYGKPDEFRKVIYGLSELLGGDLGLSAALWVIRFLKKHETEAMDKLSEDNILSAPGELERIEARVGQLESLEAEFRTNYLYEKYSGRPAIISEETIAEASQAAQDDSSLFWQVIFDREGGGKLMEDLFGHNEILREVYETALTERKIIPVSLLMMADSLGLEKQEALYLAALSQFAWGVIVSYDNVVDGHKIRKGRQTQTAIDGMPIALDVALLSLENVLSSTIADRELHKNFLKMLRIGCSGDLISRRLDWDDSPDRYEESMAGLTKAFSWFPQYIGNRVGLVEAGQKFAAFLADLHTLGQLNNDIEDIDPPLMKHEEGNDVGQRITLFWKILMDLPDNLVSAQETETIRGVFSARNSSLQVKDEEITAIIAIGKRCKAEVLARLEPIVQRVYEEAGRHLELAFDSLPVMDQRNQTYKNIFANTLEIVRRNFLSQEPTIQFE